MASRDSGGALTRRQALAGAAAGAAGLTGLQVQSASAKARAVRALAALSPACGSLADVEHVIFVLQENRSFDHYFGSYRGVRGFSDPGALPGVFEQQGYTAGGFDGTLMPFHIDSKAFNGECTHDISHNWGPQHQSWDGGAMDGFVKSHLASDGAIAGPLTMGYYDRRDLPYLYALADNFTICDGYHASVIGPSDPNHLMSISATIDPAGTNGGPVLSSFGLPGKEEEFGKLTWTTMPEQLQARGIDWKVYSLDNITPKSDPCFSYFKQYYTNPELGARALLPTFPLNFLADLELGCLPQVSWVYATFLGNSHPPLPVSWGESVVAEVVNAMLRHPKTWAKTAIFITYDENGGFFDHVPPPTPEPGTAGEFLTVSTLPSDADGVAGPIGLGMRVPMLVVSPFSKGGFVCPDTLDHTSMLRFLETRFGAEVPNLSDWRRSVTGDLTGAFNFVAAPDTSKPKLPATPRLIEPVIVSNCVPEALVGAVDELLGTNAGDQYINPLLDNYAPSAPQKMPAQEPGTARVPSGLKCAGS